MGDRIEGNLQCAYCRSRKGNDVWYAPTCFADTFRCKMCNKVNFITKSFSAKKIEKVTFNDIKKGFLTASNISWTERELKDMCSQRLKEIKEAKKSEKGEKYDK